MEGVAELEGFVVVVRGRSWRRFQRRSSLEANAAGSVGEEETEANSCASSSMEAVGEGRSSSGSSLSPPPGGSLGVGEAWGRGERRGSTRAEGKAMMATGG